MNNEEFRRLVLARSETAKASGNGLSSGHGPSQRGSAALGSRHRPSIPMTPRSVLGGAPVDLARQTAERDRAQPSSQTGKFRSSAPKGARLGNGYVDRASQRRAEEDEEADERWAKVKALEEEFKNGEIDRDTFHERRGQIGAGGDLASTHLVKGLDFKLLERVRRGEDVYSDGAKSEPTGGGEQQQESADANDDELDRLAEREVTAVARAKTEKKRGQLAPAAASGPGQRRTRDQILAELKASRAAKAAESALGARFKKIGARNVPGSSRVERDTKGREILIDVDQDGHEKRTVKGVDPAAGRDEFKVDETAEVLGMEVPEPFRKERRGEVEEVGDIFAGVGDEYDPLAGLEGDDDDDDDDDGGDGRADADVGEIDANAARDRNEDDIKAETAATNDEARNYFKHSKTALLSSQALRKPATANPAVLAAVQLASARRGERKPRAGAAEDEDEDEDGSAAPAVDGDDDDDDDAKEEEYEDSEAEEEARRRRERHRRMIEDVNRARDRDADDMDLGFGTSRLEDDEDETGAGVRISKWRGGGGAEGAEGAGGEQAGGGGGGGTKRKRGPKKRKGDVNSAADVMKLVEERRGGKR